MNFIEVNLFYKRLEFIVYQIDNKLKIVLIQILILKKAP